MHSEVRDGKVVITHDGKELVLDVLEAHKAALEMLKAINDADNAQVSSGRAKR